MRSILDKRNKGKKGQGAGVFYIFLFIMVILLCALLVGLGAGVLTYTSRTLNDVTSELGVINLGQADDSTTGNMSYYSEITFGRLNTVVQMANWGSGILIAFGILSTLIFAAAIRFQPSGFLIGFYIILMLVLVILGMIISNMYEEFHDGTDEIALELQSMTLASFILINFPVIVTILGFIGGVIIFTGLGDNLA